MNDVRTALYRHWDADGNLLYVGISLSAVHRLTQHKRDSHWHDSIANMTIEWFDNRREALAAEREAIRMERPIFNKMHNAANDNEPVGDTYLVDGVVVYLVRCVDTKLFQGIFWAESKADLWDTFDQFGDPLGFEFAAISGPGALCHPDEGIVVRQRGNDDEGGDASWTDFEPDERLAESMYSQDNLKWIPFCAADEEYGMIARRCT